MRRPFMIHARLAMAAAVILTTAMLVPTTAQAEPEARQLAVSQPVLTAAHVAMHAQADHGPGDGDSRSIIADGSFHETYRSSFSGAAGTESAKAKQDTDLTIDPDEVNPRLLRVDTTGEFTNSASGKSPFGSVDSTSEGSLSIGAQSGNFLTLFVEGTLTTGHSSFGCSAAQVQILALGLDEVVRASTGRDCGEDEPRTATVIEEFQVAPGGISIELAADTWGYATCDDSTCDPSASGSVKWDFTFSICSNSFTDGPDLVIGTPEPEVLCGGLGADEIHGGEGSDIILGDAGSDFLAGGLGADDIQGGNGSDEIWGEEADHCSAHDGGDDLDPGAGIDDVIHGCGGDDWIYPGSSNGVNAYGDQGTDRLFGGGGPDRFWGGGARDIIGGFGGDDKLFGEGGNDELAGHSGSDRLDGGSGTRDQCRPGGQAGDRRLNCER